MTGDEFQVGHGGGGGGKPICIMPLRCRRFRQRGYGGWGWLGKLASRALPFLAKGAKAVGNRVISTVADQTMNTGMRLLDDVLEGENVLDSVKHRLKESGNELRNTAKTELKDGGLKLARTVKRKLVEQQQQQQKQQGSGGGGGGRKVISKRGFEGAGRCCSSITKKRKDNPFRNAFI